MSSIKFEKVTHVYKRGTPFEKIALRDVTFEIEAGTFVGIAGQSGSGKTTLIQHINGLLKPASGNISIDGRALGSYKLKDLRRRVGVVFQYPEHQLFEETVYKDIRFGLGGGVPEAQADERVREALNTVGLNEEILTRSPFALSGGEKRRVAIAGILVMNPSILILDEPSAGLDPGARREILDFIGKLARERRMTVILLSHELDDIIRLADRVFIMKDGVIVSNGAIKEIFGNSSLLEDSGLIPPQIPRLMKKLKELMPDIDDSALTVSEAADELMKHWGRKEGLRKRNDTRHAYGPVFSGRVIASPVGSEDEDCTYCHVHGECISC